MNHLNNGSVEFYVDWYLNVHFRVRSIITYSHLIVSVYFSKTEFSDAVNEYKVKAPEKGGTLSSLAPTSTPCNCANNRWHILNYIAFLRHLMI